MFKISLVLQSSLGAHFESSAGDVGFILWPFSMCSVQLWIVGGGLGFCIHAIPLSNAPVVFRENRQVLTCLGSAAGLMLSWRMLEAGVEACHVELSDFDPKTSRCWRFPLDLWGIRRPRATVDGSLLEQVSEKCRSWKDYVLMEKEHGWLWRHYLAPGLMLSDKKSKGWKGGQARDNKQRLKEEI